MAQQAYPPDTPISSLTPMVRAFVRYQLEHPGASHTDAAKAVGFKHPNAAGARLGRKCKLILQAEELRAFRKARMRLEEAQARISKIARNEEHPHQLNALKYILQMEGAFANLELPDLKIAQKEMREMLEEAKKNGIELTSTKLSFGKRLDQVNSLPELSAPLKQLMPVEADPSSN